NNMTESMASALLPIPQLTPLARPVPFLPSASYPLAGNVDSDTTAGFVQFVPAGIPSIPPSPGCEFEFEGHFCPQSAAPPREQVAAFFRSAMNGGLATISDPFADSDGDTLRDTQELLTYHTDPADPDTDHDGLDDGYEVRNDFDPNQPGDGDRDDDGDGLTN